MRYLFTLIICGSLYAQSDTKLGTWVDPTLTDGETMEH